MPAIGNDYNVDDVRIFYCKDMPENLVEHIETKFNPIYYTSYFLYYIIPLSDCPINEFDKWLLEQGCVEKEHVKFIRNFKNKLNISDSNNLLPYSNNE